MIERVWKEAYAQIIAFKQKNGHLNIPSNYIEDEALGRRVTRLRMLYNNNELSPEKQQALDELGFVWSPRDYQWEQLYKKLHLYKMVFGDFNIPKDNPNYQKLYSWVNRQRKQFRDNELSNYRKKKLDDIAFIWRPKRGKPRKRLSDWDKVYQKLYGFYKQHGHCNLPEKDKRYAKLRNWVREQHEAFAKEALSATYIKKLEDIGFTFTNVVKEKPIQTVVETPKVVVKSVTSTPTPEVNKGEWKSKFFDLLDYLKQHGNTQVPQNYAANPELGKWVHQQQTAYIAQTLSPKQIKQLEKIGFIWEIPEVTEPVIIPVEETPIASEKALPVVEEKMPEVLPPPPLVEETQEKEIPKTIIKQTPKLPQRPVPKTVIRPTVKPKITRPKIIKPKVIKPIVNKTSVPAKLVEPLTPLWRKRFEQLQIFKKKYKHTQVPDKYPNLAKWIKFQRTAYAAKQLANNKVQLLNDIGFEWKASISLKWHTLFIQLKQYENSAFADILINYPQNTTLKEWAERQRNRYFNKKMFTEQIEKLESIGFIWNVARTTKWEKMYYQLLYFHHYKGHTNVPYTYPPNQVLADWVMQQRQNKRQNELADEHINRLNELGFEWVTDISKSLDEWMRMFKVLREFAFDNGHCEVPARYEPNPELGDWVDAQRRLYKKEDLLPQQIKRLEGLGFKWKRKRIAKNNKLLWRDHYRQLQAYKQQYGTTNVPENWDENPILSNWVKKQRIEHRQKKLSDYKLNRLTELGFVWNPKNKAETNETTTTTQLSSKALAEWSNRYRQVQRYYEQNNTQFIPKEQEKLRKWVNEQRKKYAKGLLSEEQISKLDAIGFEWSIYNRLLLNDWGKCYRMLEDFYQKYGHSQLPEQENPTLRQWVSLQRIAKQQGKLSPEKETLLTQLAFNWQMESDKILS